MDAKKRRGLFSVIEAVLFVCWSSLPAETGVDGTEYKKGTLDGRKQAMTTDYAICNFIQLSFKSRN